MQAAPPHWGRRLRRAKPVPRRLLASIGFMRRGWRAALWGTEIDIDIRPARMPADLETVRCLFRSYAEGLGIDLGFQGFEAELLALPGKYAAPRGRLLLAWRGEDAIGCIALRQIDADRCEMKRLYIRPDIRGGGLGRRLGRRICEEARAAGYRQICLDTLPSMAAARHLYADLGFRPTEPYVYNPLPGAIFLARDL